MVSLSRNINHSFILAALLLAPLISACDLNTGYQAKDGTYVYATLDEGRGYLEHPIAHIHPSSFRILNQHGYAKDNQRVYYHENTVQDADPKSFTALSELYGKDTVRVYYTGKVIPGAEPASFALFDIQWGKDSQDVYFQTRPIKACDTASFTLLRDGWQRDKECIYTKGSKLPGADPATFTVLNSWFAKDANTVYSKVAGAIAGADAATFQLRAGNCDVCAQDKTGCYRYEKQVDCSSLN